MNRQNSSFVARGSNLPQRIAALGLIAAWMVASPSPVGAARQDDAESKANRDEQLKAVMERMRDERENGPRLTVAAPPTPALDRTRWVLTADEAAEIQSLIERLADLEVSLIGGMSWNNGADFAALPESDTEWGLSRRNQKGFNSYEQVRRLVETGPKALPALLAHLDDATQTKGIVDWSGSMGLLSFERELVFNMGRDIEREVRTKHKAAIIESRVSFDGPSKHAITIGDACFQIIGEIVNRGWTASRYQPTGCAVVNSPTHDPVIAEIVRAIWVSDDPAQMLFSSLWADLHTRGENQLSPSLQTGAALRLLYWFPQESAQAITAKIDRFELGAIDPKLPQEALIAAYRARSETNGTDPSTFIREVSRVAHPETDAAILRALDRAAEPHDVMACVESKRIFDMAPERCSERLTAIARMTGEQGVTYTAGRAMNLLIAHRGEPGAATLRERLATATPNEKYSLLMVLGSTMEAEPWRMDLLATLLADQAETTFERGPSYERTPLRVCDGAAQTVSRMMPNLPFSMEGTTAELDAQIANMQAALKGEAPKTVIRSPEAIADEAVAAAPEIAALFSFTTNESFGAVDPSSTPEALCVAQYLPGHPTGQPCWRLLINGPAGTIASRMPRDCCGGEHSLEYVSPVGRYAFDPAGAIVLREPLTEAELRRIPVPFDGSFRGERSKSVGMFHSVTINRDETFALFLTRDGVLHTVDLVSRAVAEVWKAPDPDPKDTSSVEFREWELNALRGSDLFLLERQFGEEPAILFNLADRSAVPLPKMPGNGWNGGWGEYALNIMNSRNELWNVRSGVRVPIPFPGPDMKSLCCDAKRSILYAFVGSRGVIAAIDLPSGHVIARMPVPRRDCSGHLTLSVDGKKLYWCAQFLRKADEPQREEGTIAGYDVSGIAKPGSGPSDAR